MKMRVIAGTARGVKLKAPKGFTVRPTADRVKEALFSILGSRVVGALFIDLFAGSGALGIEALSRGARFCIFVDNKKENILLIKENLAKTRLENNTKLILADTQRAIGDLSLEKIKADLIYLDPPYKTADLSPLVQTIFCHKIITDTGLLVVEHASANQLWAQDFINIRQKKYGNTCLTLIFPAKEN